MSDPDPRPFDHARAGVLTLDLTGASDALYDPAALRAMTDALADWSDAVVAAIAPAGGRFAAFTGDGLILWFPEADAATMLAAARDAGALWAERGVGLVPDLRLKAGLAGGRVDSQRHPGGVSINGEAVTAACHALYAAGPGQAVGARLDAPEGAAPVDEAALAPKPKRAGAAWVVTL